MSQRASHPVPKGETPPVKPESLLSKGKRYFSTYQAALSNPSYIDITHPSGTYGPINYPGLPDPPSPFSAITPP